MRKFFFAPVIISALLIIVSAGSSWAVGLGFYLEGGSGVGDYTIDTDPGDYDDDFESSHSGLGFALDTATAPENLFNYRFQLGVESWNIDPDSGDDIDMSGYTLSNDFGFCFTRDSSRVRFWIGPELRFGVYSGETDADDDVVVSAYGIGPVLGANIKLRENMYITVKGGFLSGHFTGTIDTDFGDYDFDGDYGYSFIDAGMLFVL